MKATLAALSWRDFIAEQDYLGGVGVGLMDLKSGLAEPITEGYAPVNKAADDGALVGEEAADSHAREL